MIKTNTGATREESRAKAIYQLEDRYHYCPITGKDFQGRDYWLSEHQRPVSKATLETRQTPEGWVTEIHLTYRPLY